MKFNTTNLVHRPVFRTFYGLLKVVFVFAMVFGLMGSNCNGPQLERLASERLVLASKAMNGQIEIRMSIDGLVWTDPVTVVLDGTPAQTQGTPNISFDGTLYHLYWPAPDGNIRYASSRNGTLWLGQIDPLSVSPDGGNLFLARGRSKALVLFRESGGRVIALDPASPTAQRTTVTQSPTRAHSITHGAGKFVAAVANTTGVVEIFQSTDDGASWTSISNLPTPDSYGVHLSFADGHFMLAEKPYSVPRCRMFISPDAVSWTEAANPGCANSSQGLLATRFQSQTLFLENHDNRYLQANKNSSNMQEIHVSSVDGQFSLTTGKGPMIASLSLNQVTVNQGVRQDITIISLGFRARVGAPGSARVTWSGRLDEFASDVNAGETVPIPPFISPHAWLIQPSDRLSENNGNVDIMGAAIVGIDRGACPEGPIRNRVNSVRTALEQELETKISQGSLTDLKDPPTRQRILTELQDAVKQRLGGNPSSPPFSWLEDIGTEVVCGFNQDEQLKEKSLVLIGSEIVPDDPPNDVFNFNNWSQTINISISSRNNSKNWTIQGTRSLLVL